MTLPARLPLLPLVLGGLGAIPFMVLAGLVALGGQGSGGVAGGFLAMSGEIAAVLLKTYAVLILAFMGAVHWGLALRERPNSWQLGLSVVPALLAWPLIAVVWAQAFVVLAVLFAVLFAADAALARAGGLPRWYVWMRGALTAVVVLSLILAAALGPAIEDPLGEIVLW